MAREELTLPWLCFGCITFVFLQSKEAKSPNKAFLCLGVLLSKCRLSLEFFEQIWPDWKTPWKKKYASQRFGDIGQASGKITISLKNGIRPTYKSKEASKRCDMRLWLRYVIQCKLALCFAVWRVREKCKKLNALQISQGHRNSMIWYTAKNMNQLFHNIDNGNQFLPGSKVKMHAHVLRLIARLRKQYLALWKRGDSKK